MSSHVRVVARRVVDARGAGRPRLPTRAVTAHHSHTSPECITLRHSHQGAQFGVVSQPSTPLEPYLHTTWPRTPLCVARPCSWLLAAAAFFSPPTVPYPSFIHPASRCFTSFPRVCVARVPWLSLPPPRFLRAGLARLRQLRPSLRVIANGFRQLTNRLASRVRASKQQPGSLLTRPTHTPTPLS